MTKYISDGTWFKKGTEARLIDDYRSDGPNIGLFEGIRVCKYPNGDDKGYTIGEEYKSREICFFDEFEEIND